MAEIPHVLIEGMSATDWIFVLGCWASVPAVILLRWLTGGPRGR